MAIGAQNINYSTHPLLGALASYTPSQTSYSYYFAPAGDPVNDGGYEGGDDFTRAWTPGEQASFIAVTTRYSEVADISFSQTNTLAGADFNLQIVDNVPGGWAGYAGGTVFVVGDANAGLITHELGHSVALDHPFDGGTVLPGVVATYDPGSFGFNSEFYTIMAYRTGTYTEYPDLSLNTPSGFGTLDIAALQSIFGANQTFNSGDDTYGITDEAIAIWDGDGIDMIDFSASTTDAVIDLRAATLQTAEGGLGRPSISNIETGETGAYTIAYGVTIEGGTGGSGDDTLTGNSANNSLIGGLGSDTLVGSAGDDYLRGAIAGASIDTASMVDMTADSALRLDNYADMPGSVTIDMVLQFDPSVTHKQRLISYEPNNSSDVEIELQLWNENYSSLFLIVRNGSDLAARPTGISRAELMDGDIHRLTLSRDATSGEFRVYLDGEYRGGDIHRPSDAVPPNGSLVFGQSQGIWDPADDPNAAFEGAFGPIAIYDTALSDTAIAARSINDLADVSDPALVSYWTPQAGASFADATGGAALTADTTGPVTSQNLSIDNDVLSGQSGDDTLLGDIGSDTLTGGSGTDTLFGGEGDDVYRYSLALDDVDILTEAGGGNGGVDRLVLTDALATDLSFARSGSDLVMTHTNGEVRINGQFSGIRVEQLEDSGTLYTLRANTVGTSGADIIVAADSGAEITGGAARDLLFGGAGRDFLDGGAGDDLMSGGLENDFYIVDNAGDQIVGEIAYSAGGGIDTIRSFVDYTQPENIELLRLGTPTGTAPLSGTGNDAPGTIVGNAGGNAMIGRGGDDQLNGNGGDDTITGNTGRDTLVGGDGADRFIYTAYADSRAGGSSRDVVNGFDRGGDLIDLAAMDADTTSFGSDDAFAFIGTAAFSGQAGELRLQGLGGANAVLVEGDHNGDRVADFQVFVNLVTVLNADDFIL